MTSDHYKIEHDKQKISYCDNEGRVSKVDKFITCSIPLETLQKGQSRINKLPQEVILHNKLKEVLKNIILEPGIERMLIANILVASRFSNIACINNYEHPEERSTVFNGNSHYDTYIAVPHRINDPQGDSNPVVMPFRYLPTEACFICLAQETIMDRKSGEHFVIVKVHEKRLIRDFNLRQPHHYYKFSYLS